MRRVTSRKGREPRRTATRKVGHLSAVPEQEVLPSLDQGALAAALPGREQVVGSIVDTLVSGVRAARNPLEAELVLCSVFAAVESQAGDADDEERLAILVAMLTQVIAHAESVGTAAAMALLRVCASIGPDETRTAARAAADRLAAAGVRDPGWAATIGRPDVLRAWRQGDVLGLQENLGVLFSYRGREHALAVLIDHVLGGGVKDCWVAEGKEAARMRDRLVEMGGDDPMVVFEDIDVAEAAEILTRAMANPPVPEQDDQIEDVAAQVYLVMSRAEHLRRLAGLPVPPGAAAVAADGQGDILQLKVLLRHSAPPIWRRLEVPVTFTLARLHQVLQVAFEWDDAHLHQFELDEAGPRPKVLKDAASRRTTLAQAAGRPGARLVYRYDFGDDWEHLITVEERRPAEPGVRYPRCTGGRRAAPPEDSGGVGGYEWLLEVLADPQHPEHGERLEWIGGELDPAAFDRDALDERLGLLSGGRRR